MQINNVSVCVATHKAKECSDFYQKHFAGAVTFDCGWYINLSLAGSPYTLQFMQPQGESKPFSGEGITLNLNVPDVDEVHSRLTSGGLDIHMPPEDHPWGDRGFSVSDPAGNSVYIYSDIEPTAEFAQYYK